MNGISIYYQEFEENDQSKELTPEQARQLLDEIIGKLETILQQATWIDKPENEAIASDLNDCFHYASDAINKVDDLILPY